MPPANKRERRKALWKGKKRNLRKVRMGEVASTKMEKTIVVRVDEVKKHPIYKKAVHYSKKFKVHDEKGEASVGDVVKHYGNPSLQQG